MKSITFTPPHPIFFICDHDNLDAVIPQYDPGCITSATDTCISVGTIAAVDGDVTVTLASTIPESLCNSYIDVFSGNIEVPSRQIAIVSSEDEKLLSRAMASSTICIRIFVDDNVYPQKIWVAVHDVDERAPLQ